MFVQTLMSVTFYEEILMKTIENTAQKSVRIEEQRSLYCQIGLSHASRGFSFELDVLPKLKSPICPTFVP